MILRLQNRHRLRPPVKLYSFFLGMLIFKQKRRHARFVSSVENLHVLGAEPYGGASGVNRGVARANDCNPAAYRELSSSLVALDELQSINYAGEVFSRNLERMHCAKPDSEKNKIIFPLQLGKRGFATNFGSETEIHAQRANHFYFAEAVARAKLVLRDTIRIQPAGKRLTLKNCYRKTALAQFGGKGE